MRTAWPRRRAAGCWMLPKSACGNSAFRRRRSPSLEQSGKVQREHRDRLAGLRIHHRAQRTAQRLRATGHEALHHRRSLHGVGLRQCISRRCWPPEARRSGAGHGRCLSGTRLSTAASIRFFPQVDPATRTVRVRLVFRNPGVALKPGMYVNVEIAVPLGRQLVDPGFRRSAIGLAGHRVYRSRQTAILNRATIRDRPAARRLRRRPQRPEAWRAGRQLGQLPGGFRSAASGGAAGSFASSSAATQAAQRAAYGHRCADARSI